MKKVIGVFLAVGLLFGGMMIATPDVASAGDSLAAPAVVFNQGRDGLICIMNVGGFTGSGNATVVATSSGNINIRCNGDINEAPPSRATRFEVAGPCTINISAGGKFSLSCKS